MDRAPPVPPGQTKIIGYSPAAVGSNRKPSWAMLLIVAVILNPAEPAAITPEANSPVPASGA
uniref:Uncharacterized protein n=1 Tax=uncultured marine virus TaxID=186617 RepID=A0A0F7L062_9VIRU|nr:hypothetical protein [uncultured marine virus]